MPNRSTDSLFQLIHSLQKSEKRNFKLYVKRNTSNNDLKIVQLFDALDKMKEYDEKELINKTVIYKKRTAFKHEGTSLQANTCQPAGS